MKGLLTSFITLLAFGGLQAESLPAVPRLVIGLTIDQLRSDYLEAFSSLYGEKGFKKLQKEGRVYRNAQYSFSNIDRASAVASIYTGATPSIHGITGENWLDANTMRPVNCVEDPKYIGYYTIEFTSPANLLTSTIADELKIATGGKGLVYSIAPFRDSAVFGAGHAADGAFWLNEITGKWCGSTYYTEFPWWMDRYNERKSPDFRIDNMVWTPSLSPSAYPCQADNGKAGFKYKFDDAKRHKFKHLATSPLINDEINMLLEELLTNSNIGMDNTPDLLALTYYAGNYDHQSAQEGSLEIQDVYARLDNSIAHLLEIIDKKVGLHNVIFFITSTGYTDPEAEDPARYRIPGGDFYLNRCAALLNMYLMATYGDGQYVEGYYGRQIYINHKLIEQKMLNSTEVLAKASDFLIQFSGVNEVYSSYRLLLGAWTPDIHKIRNGYHRKRSGDLIIDVLPGWTIKDEQTYESRTVRYGQVPIPLVFLGGSIKAETIDTPVTIGHIAPTLAQFLRIRAPNASTSLPLTGSR